MTKTNEVKHQRSLTYTTRELL